VRLISSKKGWVAHPRDDRWSDRIVAKYGGIGFVPVVLIGIIAVYFNHYPDYDQGLELITLEQKYIFGLMAGAILMFLMGWADDIKNLNPGIKLVGQLIATSLVIFTGGGFQLTNVVLIDTFISFFWVIGITNAINMADNMDGLSVGIVIIGTLTVIALSISNSQVDKDPIVVAIGIVFVCALTAFWLQNRQPAKIFMGDSGSQAIGFILATISIPNVLNIFFGIQSNSLVIEKLLLLIIPATVLSVPIFDTTLVTITRKWRFQKASVGGQDHSSHRLVAMGFSEKTAVWILYLMAFVGGAISKILIQNPNMWLPVWSLFVLMLMLCGVYLGHVKVKYTVNNPKVPKWKHIISFLVYRVRFVEMILDLYVVGICYYTAHLLLFDWDLNPQNKIFFITTLPYIIFAYFFSFFSLGNYRIPWRPISFHVLIVHFKALILGTVISFVILAILSDSGEEQYKSVFFTFPLLVLTLEICIRTSFGCLDQLSIFLRKGEKH